MAHTAKLASNKQKLSLKESEKGKNYWQDNFIMDILENLRVKGLGQMRKQNIIEAGKENKARSERVTPVTR